MGSKDFLYGTKEKYKSLAKKKGYESRAVFKIKELNDKFNFLKKDHIILDLGYWPGGWIKYCATKTKICVGVDIKGKKFKEENIKIINSDIFKDETIDLIKNHSEKYDVVISDMMSQTTGNKDLDDYNSFSLCERALEIAKLLGSNTLICKIFQGKDYQNFLKKCKKVFKSVKTFKPKSSRENSREIYVIAIN